MCILIFPSKIWAKSVHYPWQNTVFQLEEFNKDVLSSALEREENKQTNKKKKLNRKERMWWLGEERGAMDCFPEMKKLLPIMVVSPLAWFFYVSARHSCWWWCSHHWGITAKAGIAKGIPPAAARGSESCTECDPAAASSHCPASLTF